MRLTVPQIHMVVHASWVNSQRAKEQSEFKGAKRKEEAARLEELDRTDPIVMNGKRLSELTSEEQIAYFNEF